MLRILTRQNKYYSRKSLRKMSILDLTRLREKRLESVAYKYS